jgi:pectate lyase
MASVGRLALAALAVAFTGALPGCGTDIAQTAYDAGSPGPVLLDCTPPATTPELPDDTEWGGDAKLLPWVLQAGNYEAGHGPGISVAARDGFRLFVNDHLIATGTASLEPTFVPLTLLPGDNAISVVVTAVQGPPALLALIDELERPYPSDTSWKVSVEPAGAWASAAYDDSGWETPLDRGGPDQNPSCNPGPGFPRGSDAVWLSASTAGSAVFRRKLSIVPIGFGAGTTGGGNAEPLLVKTTDELANALKADGAGVVLLAEDLLDVRRGPDDETHTQACPTPCLGNDTTMLTHNLLNEDMTCLVAMVDAVRTERRLRVASNKTLVGLGRGAQLYGASFDVKDSKNVIVRNLALSGVNPDLIEAGDGVSIDGADGVWLDHLSFKDISDGFVDATTGSKNLTLSWLRNDGQNAFACKGRHPRSNEFGDTTATIHHTLWQHVNGRAPLVTRGSSRVHLFDNVVTDDVDYAVGAACGAQILLEATSFEAVTTPTSKSTCSETNELGLIAARGRGNRYAADVGAHRVDNSEALEPDDAVFVPPYDYGPELAEDARFVVTERAGAGSRWALPLATP